MILWHRQHRAWKSKSLPKSHILLQSKSEALRLPVCLALGLHDEVNRCQVLFGEKAPSFYFGVGLYAADSVEDTPNRLSIPYFVKSMPEEPESPTTEGL